jgi:hypothetical protein
MRLRSWLHVLVLEHFSQGIHRVVSGDRRADHGKKQYDLPKLQHIPTAVCSQGCYTRMKALDVHGLL